MFTCRYYYIRGGYTQLRILVIRNSVVLAFHQTRLSLFTDLVDIRQSDPPADKISEYNFRVPTRLSHSLLDTEGGGSIWWKNTGDGGASEETEFTRYIIKTTT